VTRKLNFRVEQKSTFATQRCRAAAVRPFTPGSRAPGLVGKIPEPRGGDTGWEKSLKAASKAQRSRYGGGFSPDSNRSEIP